VRREEEHKRFQMLVPHAPSLGQTGDRKAGKAVPAAPAARALATPGEKRRTLAPEALAAMERGAQLAGAPRTRQPRVEPDPVEVLRPAEVLSETAAAPPPSAPVPRKIRMKVHNATREEKPGLLDAVVAATNSTVSQQTGEPALPAGFQDGFVLSRLVESRQPVSGLVVSIGVNAPLEQDGSLPANVRTFIQSLIGPADFAAQSGEEEFLLIYPGERGASAQRRLTGIAQQLWDFQLRSPGSYSILFCWGGVEVRSESIDEAIASATERMEETRRGRKILSLEGRAPEELPVRRAV
jgi:hypothetical protein